MCLDPWSPFLTLENVYEWAMESMTEIDKFDNKGRANKLSMMAARATIVVESGQ